MSERGPLQQYLRAEASMRLVGAQFILAAGQEYGSRLVKHRFGRGMQHACYRNAFDLALAHPGELTYCEGRALSCALVPVEHAWCVTPDGQVVDTTWHGDEQDYVGVRFDVEWLQGWIAGRGSYGVMAEQFPSELLRLDPATFLAQPDAAQLERTRRLQADVLAMLAAST